MEQHGYTFMAHGSTPLANRMRLLISCPDRPGIVAAVSRFLADHGANIVASDQYTMDPEGGLFFLRMEFDVPDLATAANKLQSDIADIAAEFAMDYQLYPATRKKRIAIFVSKEDHCLLELLWQWRSGLLYADIAMVVGNHPDLREHAESFDIPYHHVAVTADTKSDVERIHLELLGAADVDLVILARYMQIVTPAFIAAYPNKIINIHHSFLPAFVGGNPYKQAYQRGVKIIGATAHYVTEELDAGPIIEQDVQRVNHKHDVDTLKRIGGMIERAVLARAVGWHLEDRILVQGNKTVVFV
jgi:formyltetrahydrofolate deformylase